METGQIEQWIQDSYLSPFPQVQLTERPDTTISNVFDGRMAILVDNSPFSIIVPAGLYQFFQAPEDYYDRWIIGFVSKISSLECVTYWQPLYPRYILQL